MTVKGKIRTKGDARQTAKIFRAARKPALAETVGYWHESMMPGHFTHGAIIKYGYQRRSPGWEKRKRRLKGHNRPLVFSGRSRRQAIRQVKLSSTSKRGVAAMNLPRYFYQYIAAPGSKAPNKYLELVKTTAKEIKQLGIFFRKRVTEHIRRGRQKATTQTRTV
jgi:hypothetical protein